MPYTSLKHWSVPALSGLAVAVVLIGPTVIGVFSVPLSPAISGYGLYKAIRSKSVQMVVVAAVVFLATAFLSIYILLAMSGTAISSVSEG